MPALPIPDTIDLTDSGDEGAGSLVRHVSRSQSSASKRKMTPIDLTDSDDEGAGTPARPPSRLQGSLSKRNTPANDGDEGHPFKSSQSPRSPTKRKTSPTDGDESRPVKKSRSPTPILTTTSTEEAINTIAGATVNDDAPAANANTARNKVLHDLPELAPRFHTIFSTEKQVEYKNPDKFSIKPAFFIRWQPHDYINLAEHMRWQFGPVPFARESHKPVEEVSLIASRLVFNPLYKASEAMKRGELAREQVLGLFKTWATPSRVWAGNNVKGELDGITAGGLLRLILEDGSLKHIKLDELDPADRKQYVYRRPKGIQIRVLNIC